MPLILLSLILGIWAGWIRVGWAFPFPISPIAGKHGAIMVGSFLGTLISLERAVVLKKNWVMIVPALSGASLVFFLLDMDTWAFVALTAGSLGQAIIMGYFLEKYKQSYMIILFAGSLCWLVGNLMLLTYNMYPLAVSWWIGFLLLIITGERLELTQFLPIRKNSRRILVVALAVFVAGIIMPFHGNGRLLAAIGLIFTGIWLLKFDMATKSVKKHGQHRFSALLLLTGHGWLIATGALILSGDLYGFLYDAVLHAFFIGFVFSMIFAHGPVILPGVLGIAVKPYHASLYIWAFALEISLVIRIIADLLSMPELRMWAAMVNGLSMLAFFVSMAVLIYLGVRKSKLAI